MRLRILNIIVFNIILLMTSYGVCQSYVTIPTRYMDFDITQNLIDSIRNNKVTDFIIYQTTIDKNSIYFKENDNSYYSNMVTYLIWNEEERTKVILITDSCILLHCFVTSENIFSYLNLNKLWLRKDENIYRVVPDYTDPYDKEVVIYITPKYRRFFELGRNAYYKLNQSRNKYREEFLILLKKYLIQSNEKWRKVANFKREESTILP